MKTLVSVFLFLGLSLVAPRAPVDEVWDGVDKILGQTGKSPSPGVHRYSFPRRDLAVHVSGVLIAPPLALGSWAGFETLSPTTVMAMGDLVLLEGEVRPVVHALQSGDLDVLAVHNHLVGESPEIVYLHFGGHGEPGVLAKAIRATLDATKTPLTATAAPAAEPSAADKALLEGIQEALGRHGTLSGPVLQVSAPRAEKIEEGGVEVPPSMGMGTTLNFQVVGTKVAATGDFVLIADEVNPVIRELDAHGIEVTALHSHMLRETPRLFFLHFWAVDEPARVGQGLKAALGKVAVKEAQ